MKFQIQPHLAHDVVDPRVTAKLQLNLRMPVVNAEYGRPSGPRIFLGSGGRRLGQNLKCCNAFCALKQISRSVIIDKIFAEILHLRNKLEINVKHCLLFY